MVLQNYIYSFSKIINLICMIIIICLSSIGYILKSTMFSQYYWRNTIVNNVNVVSFLFLNLILQVSVGPAIIPSVCPPACMSVRLSVLTSVPVCPSNYLSIPSVHMKDSLFYLIGFTFSTFICTKNWYYCACYILDFSITAVTIIQ